MRKGVVTSRMSRGKNATGQIVLIVEDDAIARAILDQYLRRAGFGTVLAGSGEQALNLLRDPSRAIDWLYTDIKLPGLVDGWVVGAEFHLGHPLRPIVYATADQRHSEARTVRSLFIQKPFDPARVVDFFLGQIAAAG